MRRALSVSALLTFLVGALVLPGCSAAVISNPEMCAMADELGQGIDQIEAALQAVEEGQPETATSAASSAITHAEQAHDKLAALTDSGLDQAELVRLESAVANVEQIAFFISAAPPADHPDMANARQAMAALASVRDDLPGLLTRSNVRCD